MRYYRILVLLLFIVTTTVRSAQAQKPRLTVQKVCAYIMELKIQHPEIVLKQSVLETGWYKSKFLMSRNNLFGFRYKGKYMRFSSWKKSVEYYQRWQKRHYKKPSEDYYAFLLRIKYANGEIYNTTLKTIRLKNTCIR